MAAENCLWGAPRIHELLKLGITVSERTVSRYLRDHPTIRSQTWRTFLTNHFAQFTFILPETSPHASSADRFISSTGAQPCCRAPSWASLMNARSSMGVRHFTGRHRASISFNITFATAQPFNTAAAVARRRREGCDRPRCIPESRLALQHRIFATNDVSNE
jgi:hypothetical protein